MRDSEYIIKIAADSVAKLRRSDVERVFDNCTDEELQPTATYITGNRPDLATKVKQELDYQLGERKGAQ
jgi:hypothetical protein